MIDLPASTRSGLPFKGATGWLKQDSDKKFYAELAPRLDGLIVTANMIEKSPDSLAPFLRQFGHPFLVHPQLHRFQFVGHFVSKSGGLNQNMSRLGAAYAQGTRLPLAIEALRGEMISEEIARILAANVLRHETGRLTPVEMPLFGESVHLAELGAAEPAALIAPTLSYSHLDEDFRASVRLARASSEITGGHALLEICVDAKLLRHVGAVEELASEYSSIPTQGYLVQLVGLDDIGFACDLRLQKRVVQLISRLAAQAPTVHVLGGGFATRLLHYAGATGYALALNPTNVHGRVTPFEGQARKALRHYLAGSFRAFDYDTIGRAASRLTVESFHGPAGPCWACQAVAEQDTSSLVSRYTETEIKEGQRRRDPTAAAYHLNVFHFQLAARGEWDLVSRASAREVGQTLLSQADRLDKLVNIDHLIGLNELATHLSRGIQLDIAVRLPARRRKRTESAPERTLGPTSRPSGR